MYHAYTYKLYLSNHARPLDSYIEELYKKYGLAVNKATIHRWFMTIGPFKGGTRVASGYPSSRDSWQTYEMLGNYIDFVVNIFHHRRLVFANEKHIKDINIFGKVRRDVVSENIPNHSMNANSKNRYNILAAVTIKG